MILKTIETNEVRKGETLDCDDGIMLGITISNQWFKYKLNEREEKLFRQGLNPKEVLRVYELDVELIIIITKWDIYA